MSKTIFSAVTSILLGSAVCADDQTRPTVPTAPIVSPAAPKIGPSVDIESLTTGEVINWFRSTYRLEEEQVLRYVPHPDTPHRLKYYRLYHQSQAELIPDGPSAMWFHHAPDTDHPQLHGMTFGGEQTSIDLLARELLKVLSHELMGPQQLRRQGLSGDFVLNPDATQEQLRIALDELLQSRGIPVQLTFRDVERDVYVCRGELDLMPLPEASDQRTVELYGIRLDQDGSGFGGGSGALPELLQETGEWIGVPIVNEASNAPELRLSWHKNQDSRFTPQERKLATDPESVLNNVTIQTGLSFTRERRAVRTLFVEPQGTAR